MSEARCVLCGGGPQSGQSGNGCLVLYAWADGTDGWAHRLCVERAEELAA